MHIAIVLMKYSPYGGNESQASILAESLLKEGFRVTIFANSWTGIRHPALGFKKVPIIKFTSWLKLVSFALLSRHYLIHEKDQFDVVIAFDRVLLMDIYLAGNACHKEWMDFRRRNNGLRTRISLIINPLNIFINFIEKHIFNHIQKSKGYIIVLAQSAIKQIQKNYHVDDDRFVIIPPAINLKKFNHEIVINYRQEERNRLGIDDNILMLLHVGSGFEIKGLEATIRALSILRERQINAVLVVAGKISSKTSKFRTLAKTLDIEKHVYFLGGVETIERLYGAADVFVLPTLFETYCISAIEALSCGLPVIIGKGAGVADIIKDKNAGNVIDTPANPDELADMIEETIAFEHKQRPTEEIKKRLDKKIELAARHDKNKIIQDFSFLINRITTMP